jgi:TatD DNase family protein
VIDTHAHLYLHQFDADRGEVIDRFAAAGGRAVLMPATDVESAWRAVELGDEYAAGRVRLHAMAAVHPTSARGVSEEVLSEIASIARDPRVVAVGETGLDHYWDVSYLEDQVRSLRFHARLASEIDKPLVLHMRDRDGKESCARDLAAILRAESAAAGAGRLRGVFHCFGGPAWLVRDVMDLGFHVGLGGTLTYPKAGVAAVTAEIPMDRILLETDSPYLAPVPFRGKRNEPAYVRFVAERLAEDRGMTVDEVIEVTSDNARSLFRLPV